MIRSKGASFEDLYYNNNSVLEPAIRSNDAGMLTHLLGLGADPACSKALHRAALSNSHMLWTLLQAFRAKYPTGKKGCGAEALQAALENQDFELLDKLLDAKLDTNVICRLDEDCQTENALATAIRKYAHCNLGIITKLLSAGADPNAVASTTAYYLSGTNWSQSTVLLLAIRSQSKLLVEILIEAGADIHRAAEAGVTRTPLQCACEIGSFEIVDLLISKGASIHEPLAVIGGGTSLQLCAIGGYLGIAYTLLRQGADVHEPAPEEGGRTALEGAAEHGRLNMVRLLWDASVHKTFSRQECDRAMKLAEGNGHIACRDMLRELGLNWLLSSMNQSLDMPLTSELNTEMFQGEFFRDHLASQLTIHHTNYIA